jgi:hypothetical protein
MQILNCEPREPNKKNVYVRYNLPIPLTAKQYIKLITKEPKVCSNLTLLSPIFQPHQA